MTNRPSKKRGPEPDGAPSREGASGHDTNQGAHTMSVCVISEAGDRSDDGKIVLLLAGRSACVHVDGCLLTTHRGQRAMAAIIIRGPDGKGEMLTAHCPPGFQRLLRCIREECGEAGAAEAKRLWYSLGKEDQG